MADKFKSKKAPRKTRPVHHAADFKLEVLDSEDDLFRWFLLCFLLGKPIQSSVAVNTWRLFIDKKLDTPWSILEASDGQLVGVLHAGKYTRYQHVMARALHSCMRQLVVGYDGSLLLMLESSENETEFDKRLQQLYGVGPKTAEIIMRETSEYFARRAE